MKAVLLVICMGWFLQGFGQQSYFVLIQSEKSQPFYARVLDKNYSSSSIGHLIISNLKDSAYTVVIGFPQNRYPEQEFLIRISRKDRGYQLKNMGDKGWALFDTRTMELIPPVKAERSGIGGGTAVYIRKTDDFARLMAGVVNDTAVMYAVVEPVVKKEEPVVAKKEEVKKEEPVVVKKVETEVAKPDVAKKVESEVVKPDVQKKVESEVVKSDVMKKVETDIAKPDVPRKTETEIAKSDEPKKPETDISSKEQVIKPDTAAIVSPQTKPEVVVIKEPESKPVVPAVKIITQFTSDTGYHMMVVDDLKDSIRIFIPSEKVVVSEEKKTAAIVNEPKEVPADTTNKPAKLVMINSDCRNFAASNDVDKLRVKLLQEKDADGRIAAAKKAFKTKCFNAQQVKSLTEFFPYDEQKYSFLEAAYPFVSDTGNFKELVTLFSDPVYNQRFRKLVRLD